MKKSFLIPVILLMLLFCGCTNQQSNYEVNETGQTLAQATGTTVSSGGAGGLNELLNLFKSRPKQYTITYDIITKGDEAGDIKQEMTQYVASEEKMRMDTSYVSNGVISESRIFVLGKDMVMCSKQEGSWSCTKFTGQENQTKDPEESNAEIEDNIASSSVTRIGDRVIAGMTAKCYSLKMTLKDSGQADRLEDLGLESWEGTYCVSTDGTVLYSESKAGGVQYIIEAKSYLPSVSESDFVPPAEPTSMEDLLGGLGVPSVGDGTGMTLPEGYEDFVPDEVP